MKTYIILQLAAGVIAASILSGCGYAFMGTESIDAWGYKVKFASGATVRAGINSVDAVDDSQGVNTRGVVQPATTKQVRY